jgi:DNA mismatch repair protein MutL
VDNRGLNFALIEGYHTSLMKGRYPVGCLFIEIDPALVDVNIHPAKREVKFHREYDVRRLVAEAVRQTLLRFHQGARAGQSETPASVPPSNSSTVAQEARADAAPASAAERLPPEGDAAANIANAGLAPAGQTTPADSAPPSQTPASAHLPGFPSADQTTEPPSKPARPPLNLGFGAVTKPDAAAAPAMPAGPVPLLEVPMRLIGVVGRLYVLLESDRGLVLLDQHAAHERILFEQMLDRLERAERAPAQKLLLPQTVELPPRDAVFLRENLEALSRLGVGLSEFGDRTFLLDALPPFVKAKEPRQFVLEMVDQLKAAGQSVNTLRLGEDVVAKTVCRHAVKANDPLAGAELENLVNDLRRCAMPYTCPHGRPTLIEMNYRELEKKFGRTQ